MRLDVLVRLVVGLIILSGVSPAPAFGDTAAPLANCTPVSGLSGAAGSEQQFRIEVPSDCTELTISIAGGTGDADLYVKRSSQPTTTSFDYRPYLIGSNESVTVLNPSAGTWYIMVRAYQAFNGLTLVACYVGGGSNPPASGVSSLTNCVPVSGLSGSAGSEQQFRIEVPSGCSELTITITGGTGDADLYVKMGSQPTATSYDYRPYLVGSEEWVTVPYPSAGSWYIMIRAHQTYSGLTLQACFVDDGTTPPEEPVDEIVPSNTRSDFSPGDRVVLLVVPLDNDGSHTVGLYPGTMGTVVCCDHSDPGLPLFVSWDNWTNGKSNSSFCDPPVISYRPNSGWWMACTQIGKPGQPIDSCPRALMAKYSGKVVALTADSANTYAGRTTLTLETNSRVGIYAAASATSAAGGTWTAWLTPSTVGPGEATVELSVRGTNVNAGVLACGETTNVAAVTLSLGPPELVDEIVPSDDGDFTPPVETTSLPEDSGGGGSGALIGISYRFDWRGTLALPLEDPGQGHCGSCWAFTFAKAFQAKIELNNGGDLDLSEQHLLVRADAGGCCGGNFDDARALLESEGPVLGDSWPYREVGVSCPVQVSSPGKPACYHLPYKVRPTTLGQYNPNDLLLTKASVILNGPAYISFITGDASSSAFRSFWYSGSSPGSVFRYNSSEQQRLPHSVSRKSHAVTLIGWDDGKQAWLCLNSWGSGGPNGDGTFWLAYDDACVKGVQNFRIDLLRPASSEMVVQFAPSSTYGSYWLTISGSSKFEHLSIGHIGPGGPVEYAYWPPQDINVSVSLGGSGTATINATATARRDSGYDKCWSISKRIDDARLAGRKIQIKAVFDTAAGTSTYNSPQFNSTSAFESGGFQ